MRFNMPKCANVNGTSAHKSTEGVPATEVAARRLTAKVPTLPKALRPFVHTAIEQLHNMADYVRQPWAQDERQALPYMLKKTLDRMEG
jgi:hypothetical protein